MQGEYYESSYGGADVMESIKDYARDYSLFILGALIVAIIYIAWSMYAKKENMYNPGSTAWFQLGNWKENMIDPAQLNCADVSMTGYDSEDPYRTYATTEISENFTDAKLSTQLFR